MFRRIRSLCVGCSLYAFALPALAQLSIPEVEIRIYDKYGVELNPATFTYTIDTEGPFAEIYTGAGSCIMRDLSPGQLLKLTLFVPPYGPSSTSFVVRPDLPGVKVVVGDHVSVAIPYDHDGGSTAALDRPGTLPGPLEVHPNEGGTLNQGAPPPFDHCEEAVVITLGAQAGFDNAQATTDVTDPAISCFPGGPSVGARSFWFQFVAPTNHLVVRTTSNGTPAPTVPTLVTAFTGSCDRLTEISCGLAGIGEVIDVPIETTVGETIFVQLATLDDLNIGVMPATLLPGAPPNDECDAPTPLPCDGTIVVDNLLATTGINDPDFLCTLIPAEGDGSLWYELVPNSPTLTLETAAFPGSEVMDTLLAVYEGGCFSPVQIGCSDDEGDGLFSRLTLSNLAVGEPLLVEVATFPTAPKGAMFLDVQCCAGGFLSYGTGCGGAGGAPTLSSASCPMVGTTAPIEVRNGFSAAHGCLIVSTGMLNVPLFGCNLLVDPATDFLFPNNLDPSGNASIPLVIAPEFAGQAFFLQGVYLDPGAPEGFAFTNGLMMTTTSM